MNFIICSGIIVLNLYKNFVPQKNENTPCHFPGGEYIFLEGIMTRKEERELAFTLIFEKIFNEELSVEEIFNNAIESRLIENNTFAFSIAQLTYEHCDEIDSIINEISVGWKVERLPKVSLAILRLALCEILYVPSIPNGVSINEAVELAKKFASQDDAAFINGVLGRYVREKFAE